MFASAESGSCHHLHGMREGPAQFVDKRDGKLRLAANNGSAIMIAAKRVAAVVLLKARTSLGQSEKLPSLRRRECVERDASGRRQMVVVVNACCFH